MARLKAVGKKKLSINCDNISEEDIDKKKLSINWDNISKTDINTIAELISESYDHDHKKFEKYYGLKVLHQAKNWKTGFEAIALQNGKDVLILFPGTKNKMDCINDILLGVTSRVLQCEVDVEDFFDNVMKEVDLENMGKVICLGHSLGAVLAAFAVATQDEKPIQFCDDIRFVGIESPGLKSVLSKFSIDPEKYNIFNSSTPNVINSILEHIIDPVIVGMPLSEKAIGSSLLGSLQNMFISHSIDSFRGSIEILDSSEKNTSLTRLLSSAALDDAKAMISGVSSKVSYCASAVSGYVGSGLGYFSSALSSSKDMAFGRFKEMLPSSLIHDEQKISLLEPDMLICCMLLYSFDNIISHLGVCDAAFHTTFD